MAARAQSSGGSAHHALLVNSRGVFTVHGRKVADPLGSTDELLSFLEGVREHGHLTPCNASPQVWICGIAAAESLGWYLDYDDPKVVEAFEQNEDPSRFEMMKTAKALLSERVGEELAVAGADERGWTVGGGEAASFAGGPLVNLKWAPKGARWFMVNVFVEPYLWTVTARGDYGIVGSEASGTMLPEGERELTAELARRLQWMVGTLGTLPSITSAGTGAALLDAIYKSRKKSGKGQFVEAATPWPPLLDPDVPVEEELLWARTPSEQELDEAEYMVTVDQRASYLASAGSLDLGWGRARLLEKAAAAELLESAGSKIPFGLWRVRVPAGAELFCNPLLPLPLPCMRPDEAVTEWITTESLWTLCSPTEDGGAGLDVWEIEVEKAYVYEHQGRILEAWAKVLREARSATVAAGDRVGKSLIGAIYKGYVGRLKNEQSWSSSYKRHHFQPMWRYAIVAASRRRGRRQAARIAEQTGLFPIAAHTDSWTYLCRGDQIDSLIDHDGYLGRLELEKKVRLTEDMKKLLSTEEGMRGYNALYGEDDTDSGDDTPAADTAENTTDSTSPAAEQDSPADRDRPANGAEYPSAPVARQDTTELVEQPTLY